jgi:hypothetical protein
MTLSWRWTGVVVLTLSSSPERNLVVVSSSSEALEVRDDHEEERRQLAIVALEEGGGCCADALEDVDRAEYEESTHRPEYEVVERQFHDLAEEHVRDLAWHSADDHHEPEAEYLAVFEYV